MTKILSTILFSLLTFYLYAADVEGKITHATCGNKNGKIELIMNGGIAPYSFEWSGQNFLSTDQDIFNLAPGDYIVNITDALCGRLNRCVKCSYEHLAQLF